MMSANSSTASTIILKRAKHIITKSEAIALTIMAERFMQLILLQRQSRKFKKHKKIPSIGVFLFFLFIFFI
jgi:hypothetical protein